MPVERVACKRCGEFFISHDMQKKVLKIAKEKGLDNYQSYFEPCQKCRAQAFVDQLADNRLERVDRVKHVAKRRREELQSVKKDLGLGTTVYKSECFICNQGCDAQIHVKDGKVVRVEGDSSSPLTNENPHYEQTQCMLIWGCNLTTTNPVQGLGMIGRGPEEAK